MTTAAPAAPLLSLDEARERMLAGVEPLPTEEVSLEDAAGRVLATPITSLLTLPPWDNSAMDGFAVRAADITSATPEAPVMLPVVGESAAGRDQSAFVERGTAVRILTGAPMPRGADTVVPVEDTDAPMGAAKMPSRVAVNRSRPVGAHVRGAGGDLRAGMPLLDAGRELTAADLALIAAGGHGRATVHRRPRVSIMTTGDELVPPGEPLGGAQIPDSNSIALLTLARASGADARSLGIGRDVLDDVVGRVAQGLQWADVIVASGGVSVGAHDVVKDAFARIGRIDLWRVAVQPGKPLAFGRARRADGADGALLFGLPGNPVSSQVTFELFVRPALRRMAGHRDVIGREIVRARMSERVSKAVGRRAFLRVRLVDTSDGWHAEPAGGQESHMLTALAAADGLAVVAEEKEAVEAGDEVEVIRLR